MGVNSFRNIRGHEIKFHIATNDHARRRQFYENKIDGWAAAINQAPVSHVEILSRVPIFIVDSLGGRTTGSGWYPPDETRANAACWLRPGRIRATRVPAAVLDALGIDHGIIGVTRNACGQPWWQLSPLHEMGHCVDFHSAPNHHGLMPPLTLQAYRRGNTAFQGQRYSGCGRPVNQRCLNEFAAEAYSRFLFLRLGLIPNYQVCRGSRGTPPCVSHSAACQQRHLLDLQNSPAFSGIQIITTQETALLSHGSAPVRMAQAGAFRRRICDNYRNSGIYPRALWRYRTALGLEEDNSETS